MTNTISQMDFEDALSSQNVMWEDVRTEYSGRGMYGSTCIGIVLAPSEADRVKVALARAAAQIREDIADDEDDLEWENEETLADKLDSLADSARFDNMGLDAICYWPGWEFDS